jgi:hypothetical protein
LQAARSRVDAGEDLVAAFDELDRQRRVQHVRRRHPQVQPARGLARQLLDVGQERDHVVARALLVLEDPRRVQLADGLRPHGGRRPGRDRPRLLHLGAGRQLDAQPDLVAMTVGPQLEQLGARVSGNHPCAPVLTKTRRWFKDAF